MYFDISPTFLSDYRRKKYKCTIFNREGVQVRVRKFSDIYDAWNWGYRKINKSRA